MKKEEENDIEYTKKITQERKIKYSNRIMGELEAYLERSVHNWEARDEEAILDLLNLVNNTIKSRLSNNDRDYLG